MGNSTSKSVLALSLGMTMLVGCTVIAADRDHYGKASVEPVAPAAIPNITFLPRDVSKGLEITRVPTAEPVPMIVGTIWRCHVNQLDFEICRLKIVICISDQSSCIEIN